MSIESVGTGLKSILVNIQGIKVYALNELPDSISPPCILILPGEVTYDSSLTGDYEYTLRVLLLLAKQDTPSAFNKILDYIEPSGDKSVLAWVQTDRTLDGSCDDCKVLRNSGVGVTNWGGIPYLSTEWTIAIY